MVYMGQELKLLPGCCDQYEDDYVRVGTVIYINVPHSWFILEYTTNCGTKVREAFKFSQVKNGMVR